MNTIDDILAKIEEEYRDDIAEGARNYLEVDLGKRAETLGFTDLADKYRNVNAIVPLKRPFHGMKVRIDGRTFVNYQQTGAGIAIPGYVAGDSRKLHKTFIPNDSMICNFVN